MAIRKRISDRYGHDYKEFARRRRDGPLPVAPRKPKLEERLPFTTALDGVPLGQTFDPWFWRQLTDPYIGKPYTIWGVTLEIWPAARPTMGGDIECVGVFIIQKTKTKRGICPKITLRGGQRSWYRQVLDWIDENNYGG